MDTYKQNSPVCPYIPTVQSEFDPTVQERLGKNMGVPCRTTDLIVVWFSILPDTEEERKQLVSAMIYGDVSILGIVSMVDCI